MSLLPLCFAFTIFFSSYNASAQRIELLNSGSGRSLRGLSVVSNKIIWVSGSHGTVGKSTDGGKSWQFISVPGYETKEFRDIEAFSSTTAVIIAIDEPALILKTSDGGKSWKKVYENKTPGMFLDAMEFWNAESGIVIGDPIKGRFFVSRTFDGGNTWMDIPFDKRPAAESGEACFAASGTNVRALARDEACFVTGGSHSRFFWKGIPVNFPIKQGNETEGANSIAVWRKGRKNVHLIVVGGDFKAPGSRTGNCALSKDGGKTWSNPSNPPNGYRSCVEFMSGSKVVSCGLTGVDVSADGGDNWNTISETGFHVCRKAKKGEEIFLAGEDGRIGKIVW